MAISANQLLKEYKQYNMPGFINQLEKQYGERTNYNKDLIEQENRLTQDQLALPAQLRNEYYASPIRNALAQESLIAGRQANVGSQLGTVTDLLNARKQQYADILGKATSTYQMNMENAWRLYQDAVQREQFNRSQGGGGGNAGGSILEALIKAGLIGDKNTKAKPVTAKDVDAYLRTNPDSGQVIQGPIQIKNNMPVPLWYQALPASMQKITTSMINNLKPQAQQNTLSYLSKIRG